MDHLDSPRARAGRRLWIGLPGPTITDADRRHLESLRPGGLVAFRRNITDPDQFRSWCDDARSVLGPELWITIDQEGGSVVRFSEAHGVTVFPGNAALGRIAVDDLAAAEELAERQGETMARELRELGVNLNLAPVVDLLEADSLGIGVRSYGSDPRVIVALAHRFVRGHHAQGVRCCLKHYPGLGAAHEDPHFHLARIPRSRDLDRHRRVFAELLEREAEVAVMTTHVIAEEIDDQRPATLSPATIDSLRRGYGFDGPIVTDDLEMEGLASTSFDEVVRDSAGAGHDVLLIAHRADRQLRAAEVLADVEQIRPAEAAASHRRLDQLTKLAPNPPTRLPTTENGAELAQRIADLAVGVARDPGRLLPLDATPIDWWGPRPGTDDDRCDPLRGESLTTLRTRCDPADRWHSYDPNQPATEVADGSTTNRAALVIAGLRESDARRRFVAALGERYDGLVVVLTGDPRDIDAVPASATVVQGLGFRPVHQRAIADRLFGPSNLSRL